MSKDEFIEAELGFKSLPDVQRNGLHYSGGEMTLPKKCCGKCKWWEKKESGANLKFCIIMFSDEGKSCPCFTPRK